MRGGARRGHKKSHSASPSKKKYSPYLTHGAAALGGVAAMMGVNRYRSGKFLVAPEKKHYLDTSYGRTLKDIDPATGKPYTAAIKGTLNYLGREKSS